jgi:invasion protein IalB
MDKVGSLRARGLLLAGRGLFFVTLWAMISTVALPASHAMAQETAVFGDWEMTCAADEPCKLTQANVESGTDNVRMRSAVSLSSDNRVLLSVTLPTAVLLTDGPWLTVDGVFVGELEYITCASGCLARTSYHPGAFGLISGGSRGIVTVISNSGQRIGVTLSLSGLADGVTALASRR